MHLGVNIDHVATLRQARRGIEPEPLAAAVIAELAGADGITVHLREDRRHINDRDLRLLREMVRVELNLEMAATQEMLDIALKVRPDMVTLVPEKREELTTEGGLEVAMNRDYLQGYVRYLKDAGIPVSLFINPDSEQIKASHKINANFVEIHTGTYANAADTKERETEFERVKEGCKLASKLGLVVNAGHGLNYQNVGRIAAIRELRGLYIGHSIISRAVLVGLERAVREMKELIDNARVGE